jgi:hypothetical protein
MISNNGATARLGNAIQHRRPVRDMAIPTD